MDLIDVREVRVASSRADLVFGEGEIPLGGGTWLFSEPQPGVTGLVDLTRMGWEPLVVGADGSLTIAATCTIRELSELADHGWAAHVLFAQCCHSLLASFKVWGAATVGGNICAALPAGPMTSLTASLGGIAVIWQSDGGDRRVPMTEFVTGPQTTALGPGEVLRQVELPAAALNARVGFRRISLAELGRSGTLVIARVDADGAFVVTVTAGTPRPVQFRFRGMPTATELHESLAGITDWYADAHGSPDWRRAMSMRFAEQLRQELT